MQICDRILHFPFSLWINVHPSFESKRLELKAVSVKITALISAIKAKVYKNPRPSLNNLDQKLEAYLNFRHGFFIEVGANDGYTQSNTYFLEKKRGWQGILIEGIPELYEKCKKLRTHATVYHCALVSSDYPQSTVRMHYAHLMSVVDGAFKTAEEQQQHINVGLEVQNLAGSYTVDVPARTLESILDETPKLPKIDFFSLDVEGCELDVLKGLNLKKYRPTYILVEARYFDEVNSLLTAEGYEQIAQLSHHDFLYRTQ